jgi:hypothetical protein
MAITLDGTTGIVAQAIDVVTPISVSDGGTGLITVGTSGNILTSNGTSWASTAPSASLLNTAVTPGTSGNVLTSDGSNWISSAPSVSNFLLMAQGII